MTAPEAFADRTRSVRKASTKPLTTGRRSRHALLAQSGTRGRAPTAVILMMLPSVAITTFW